MYGESYVRPVSLFFVVAAVFALLYLWGGFYVPDGNSVREVKYDVGWAPSMASLRDYTRAMVHALSAAWILSLIEVLWRAGSPRRHRR